MAPLFGQREKVQDDLATPSQTQAHAGSGENGGRIGSSATGSGHYMTTSSGVHHHPPPTNPPNLTSGNKDGGHHHHHQRQGAPPPLPMRQQPGLANDTSHGTGTTTKGDTAALRKYLVLLQDCLAIKFAPLVNGHQSHPYPFAFNNNSNKQKNCCGEIVDDEEDDLASHRRDNFYSHRVSSSANGPKNGSNSINEPHANRSLHANSLGNHNSSNNSHQHQHINFHLGNNNNHNGSIHDNNEDPQQAFNLQSHHQQQKSRRRETFHFLESQSGGTTLNRPASCNFSGAEGFLGSNTAEVDHSLHGLYLYKGFKEANVQCYWNDALSETFRNIQYKGYIVPSIILVGALPKFLSILRTAWSRQMLRSPAGYRIDFIGEIEEVIADPIQKGQFAPLSDSLCWAILELTSLGQEAFVDSIMSALQIAFPTMSCPSRELVFQTLEKLIKERKVYQTSRGYFVVTPDIFRYMVSGNFHEVDAPPTPFLRTNAGTTLDALLHPNCQENDKSSFSHQSWDSAVSTGDRNRCSSTSTGEELIEIPPSPKLKRHNSLKMIRQRDNVVTQMSSSTGQQRHSLRLPKSKSCGRVNDAGEEDEEVKTSKVKSSTIGHISRAMRSLRTGGTPNPTSTEAGDSEKSKKNKSLLSKLFPFRRSTSKPRNEKSVAASSSVVDTAAASGLAANPSPRTTTTISSSNGSMSPPTKVKHSENAKDSAKFISTQTQTSNSTEQLCVPSITLLASSPPQHPAAACTMRTATNNEKNAGRMTGEPNTDDSSPDNVLHHQTCMNGDGGSHQTRPSSRRSMSILDESPLYDVLQDVPSSISPHHHHHHHHQHISPNFQVGCPVGPPTFPGFHHHRGESSRCSTLSSQAASSLGYGSQGQPSLSNYSPNMDSGLASYGYYIGDSSNSNSHSPCPSTGAYGNNNVPSSQQYGSYHQNHNGSNGGTTFPQPAKPTAYSSARYKNSYEWYRKRYPNYISPVGRSSPLYASLTAPRSKSRSRSTYESLLTPTNEKHHNGGGRNMHLSENTCKFPPAGGNNNQDGMMMSNTNANSSDIMRQSQQDGSVSTTTVTQAVKSTTNMELELLLPLGKIMKAALHAKKDAIREAWLRDEMGPAYAAYADRAAKQSNQQTGSTSSNINNNNESIKVNLDNSGAKLRVGEPTTKTEVTTVVNNNGVIETHFDSSSGINQPLADLTPQNMRSTVEIKTLGGVTDVVLVNGKTGEETKIISAGGHQRKQRQNSGSKVHHHHHQQQPILSKSQTSDNNAYEKILDKRSSANACVKISDIGKDCGTEEDIIKVC